MEMELTHEEKRAIAALKRVAKMWPKSLWLFSASGTLCVMRIDEYGHHAHTTDTAGREGGINRDYFIDSINIDNDGGDW